MAIINYKTPTPEQVQIYRTTNNIPDTASSATLPSGEVVFYDANVVLQLYPEYGSMTTDEKLNFLAKMPAGVMLRIPVQPIVAPDTPGGLSNPTAIYAGLHPVVNLASLVSVDNPGIKRTYVKDSMSQLDQETIIIKNLSNIFTIDVDIQSTYIVTYEPSSFRLPPGLGVLVKVSFSTSEVNKLIEGVSAITTIVNLTSPDVLDLSTNPGIIIPVIDERFKPLTPTDTSPFIPINPPLLQSNIPVAPSVPSGLGSDFVTPITPPGPSTPFIPTPITIPLTPSAPSGPSTPFIPGPITIPLTPSATPPLVPQLPVDVRPWIPPTTISFFPPDTPPIPPAPTTPPIPTQFPEDPQPEPSFPIDVTGDNGTGGGGGGGRITDDTEFLI